MLPLSIVSSWCNVKFDRFCTWQKHKLCFRTHQGKHVPTHVHRWSSDSEIVWLIDLYLEDNDSEIMEICDFNKLTQPVK